MVSNGAREQAQQMRRAGAKRKLLFFLGLEGKIALSIASRTGASFSVSLCVCHCAIVCDSTFVSAAFVHRVQLTRHQCQAPAGSVHACTQTKPSRADAVGSRSEIVEL